MERVGGGRAGGGRGCVGRPAAAAAPAIEGAPGAPGTADAPRYRGVAASIMRSQAHGGLSRVPPKLMRVALLRQENKDRAIRDANKLAAKELAEKDVRDKISELFRTIANK